MDNFLNMDLQKVQKQFFSRDLSEYSASRSKMIIMPKGNLVEAVPGLMIYLRYMVL